MKAVVSQLALVIVLLSSMSHSVEAQEVKTDASKSVASKAVASKPIATPNVTKPLDLKTPDIRKLFKPDEITKSASGETIEKIEVAGTRELLPQTDTEMPKPWMGPGALVWAFIHPTSAWRIFAPLTPDQAQAMNGPPDLDYENFHSRQW